MRQRFLFFFPHQLDSSPFVAGAVLARALMNDGHEVHWIHGQQTLPICHPHELHPASEADCAECVLRGRLLHKLEIRVHPLLDWLADGDREAAAQARGISDIGRLRGFTDQGVPVGPLALYKAGQAGGAWPGLAEGGAAALVLLQRHVESAVLAVRGLRRLLDRVRSGVIVDRLVLHRGADLPDAVVLGEARGRGLPVLTFDTGPLPSSLVLRRDAATTDLDLLCQRWPAFRDQPLSLRELQAVRPLLPAWQGGLPLPEDEEAIAASIAVHRFTYHALVRYALLLPVLPPPGPRAEGRLAFEAGADLVRGRWPGLDAALDMLVHDRQDEPAPRQVHPAEGRWERAVIAEAIGPPAGPLAPTALDARGAVAAPESAASALREDFELLLGHAPPGGAVIGVGPLGAALRGAGGGRLWLQVDPRGPGFIDGDLSGDPASLPLRERAADAVVSVGALALAADPQAEALAYRRWLRPGGVLLLATGPRDRRDRLHLTGAGARELLAGAGFEDVVVRDDPFFDQVAICRVAQACQPAPEAGAPEGDGPAWARLLVPCQQQGQQLCTGDGRVLGVRRGTAWSTWSEDLGPGEPCGAQGACHHFDRPEVRALIAPRARRVLDVGCAAGALGLALKSERPYLQVDGIEVVAQPARQAAHHLDRVFVGPVERVVYQLQDRAYDVIVCAGVLEHTLSPGEVLRLLRPKLLPEGEIVVSMPNVRHYSVLRQLLEGRFTYVESGILDRTHVRFFTRQSMLELFAHQGFEVMHVAKVIGEGAPPALVSALYGAGLCVESLEDEAAAYQYLFVCRQAPPIPPIGEDRDFLESLQVALSRTRAGAEALGAGRLSEALPALFQAAQRVALLSATLNPQEVPLEVYGSLSHIYTGVLDRLFRAATARDAGMAREAEAALLSLSAALAPA